jgi:hypothetical protein
MNNKIIDEFYNLIHYYKSLPLDVIKYNKLNYKIRNFENFITFIKKLDFEIKSSNDLN